MAQLDLARARIALKMAETAALTPRVLLKPALGGELGINKPPVGVDLDIRPDILQGGTLTAKANAARNHLAAAEAKLGVARLEDNVPEHGLLRSLAAGGRKTTMLRRQIGLLAEARELYRRQYFDTGAWRISGPLDNEEEYYSRQAQLAHCVRSSTANRLNVGS